MNILIVDLVVALCRFLFWFAGERLAGIVLTWRLQKRGSQARVKMSM